MFAWRLARKEYIRDLSGEGARLFGGRWNHKGTPILYTSEHCSLAFLELLVHSYKEFLPDNIYQLKLFVPDSIKIQTIERKDLHTNWRQYPAPNRLADVGTNWFLEKETVLLKVPSVIVPQEWNLLLNPLHSQFKQCKIAAVKAFKIDFRINQ